MSKSAVIIGAGVIGAACAHYLVESGWRVTLIDRGRFAGACSHGNCGLVCPSHVLPLAEPGAIRRALKSMFQKNSPFHIKPRLSLDLWAWLWNFARRCNTGCMMESGRAIQALLHSSMSLYQDLVERHRLDCEWETRGLLFAYGDAAELDAYAKTNDLLAQTFHEPATRYAGDDLLRLEPALRPGLAGGWYYQSDAHLRPDKLMSSWRRLLESRGAAIHENCEFKSFTTAGGRATAVETSKGAFAADAFVIATGAMTPLLNSHLGMRIPIQPGKGYSITMPRPAVCPAIPLIFPETRVAVTPLRSGYRLGSMMEFAGYDDSINPARLRLLKDGAAPYLREPYAEPVQEEWFGWRPMTADGKPIIDRTPAMPNVMIAAGHNMLGLSMAPATGRLVAEMLNEFPPHIDPIPYLASRF
jgi:D-amino-acid dehydrogenase